MSQAAPVQGYDGLDDDEVIRRLRLDLEAYCTGFVRIQDKQGRVHFFNWNRAQRRLHAAIEKQKLEKGWVRVIILKARQMGISTYIGSRFYRNTSLFLGRNTFILTHEDKATQQLFNMVKRIHDHMDDRLRPATEAANANELKFAGYDGGYRVGTAKNQGGLGRSMTLQQVHGSEMAFWPQAANHFGGIGQAVPGEPGTEIIMESTANGPMGDFYEEWKKAEAGLSDYLAIFLPWTLEDAYRREPPQDWQPTGALREYAQLYGLDRQQAFWAERKNVELGGQPGEIVPLFQQEYPITAAEAFQATGVNGLIAGEYVARARRVSLSEAPGASRVLGIDVARGGRDSTWLIDRKGWRAGHAVNERIDTDNILVLVDKVTKTLIANPDIRRVYIDASEGFGHSLANILSSNGFADRVCAVSFGGEASEPLLYLNKRAEMYGRMRDWFKAAGGADLVDSDELHSHIVASGFAYGLDGVLKIEPKEAIKKKFGFSPDGADALALTFTEILPVEMPEAAPYGAADGYGWAGIDTSNEVMDWRAR
ncbi:hypothetical protein [Ferrovibrio terrae]|uniref:hypothetical protein n=1 Tax=Ferrovibrio terrae TaxID=2594003 RepID=UPI003137E45E